MKVREGKDRVWLLLADELARCVQVPAWRDGFPYRTREIHLEVELTREILVRRTLKSTRSKIGNSLQATRRGANHLRRMLWRFLREWLETRDDEWVRGVFPPPHPQDDAQLARGKHVVESVVQMLLRRERKLFDSSVTSHSLRMESDFNAREILTKGIHQRTLAFLSHVAGLHGRGTLADVAAHPPEIQAKLREEARLYLEELNSPRKAWREQLKKDELANLFKTRGIVVSKVPIRSLAMTCSNARKGRSRPGAVLLQRIAKAIRAPYKEVEDAFVVVYERARNAAA